MICPQCKAKIKEVNVWSECLQIGTLRGNKITDYGPVETVLDTQDIECPECHFSIMEHVKES